MDRLETAVMRGEEASRVLSSELFEAAFADTRKALFEAIAALPTIKDERAQELHCMLRSLSKVRRCLEVHIETGQLATREIEGRKKLFDLKAWRA